MPETMHDIKQPTSYNSICHIPTKFVVNEPAQERYLFSMRLGRMRGYQREFGNCVEDLGDYYQRHMRQFVFSNYCCNTKQTILKLDYPSPMPELYSQRRNKPKPNDSTTAWFKVQTVDCTTPFLVLSVTCAIVSLILIWEVCQVTLMINIFTISVTQDT